jgi:alkylation response protein AidB-like acyl-CoA dehydrogenase
MHASTSFDYRAAAKRVAAKLDETAVERDRNGNHPYEEVDLLRKEGLLELIAPKEFGGHGLRWQQSLEAVRIISAADGSIGQLLAYHYVNSHVPLLFGTVHQAEKHTRQQVLNQWYVADSVNPLSPALAVTENDQGFVINGKITFSTGVPVSQRVIITPAYGGAEYFASVPTDRPGLIVNDDWDNIGLRQSASGSVTFANYQVLKEELFTKFEAGTKPNAFATLVTPLIQLGFVNFYLGIASGALDRAAEYTRNTSRPWFLSDVDHAVNDPYILSRYGSLVSELDASIALAKQAAHKVQTAFDIGDSLSPDERAEAAFEVAKAKIHSTETALKITTKIFEVTGARATSRQYSFDRFWRNVRTHTLHDPVFYKEKEVGNYFLNGVKPEFTLYT